MRPEHDGAAFGRAVGVGDRGLGQRALQRRHQAFAHRRRAHADELDGGEIGALQRSPSRSIIAIIGGTAVSQVQR